MRASCWAAVYFGVKSALSFDDLCWKSKHDVVQLSLECCRNFLTQGNAQCWQGLNTFAKCCVPKDVRTGTDSRFGLLVHDNEHVQYRVEVLKALTQQDNLFKVVAHGEEIEIVWRRSWTCPPAAAAVLEKHSSCTHPHFTSLLTDLVVKASHRIASYAASQRTDFSAMQQIAAAHRFLVALAELRCLWRYYYCFQPIEIFKSAMLQVCAIMDLALLQLIRICPLTSLLNIFPSATQYSISDVGICKTMSGNMEGVVSMIEAILQTIFVFFDDEGYEGPGSHFAEASFTGVVRKPRNIMISCNTTLYHLTLAPEFDPACDELSPSAAEPVLPPLYTGSGNNAWQDTTGSWTWHLNADNLWNSLFMNMRSDMSFTVVNLGAESGECNLNKPWMYDPANCALQFRHSGGVLLEGDETKIDALRTQYAGRADILCNFGYFDPSTVLDAIFAARPCDPESVQSTSRRSITLDKIRTGHVDLLKVDLDFGDCDFIEILAGQLRPKLVHAEFVPFLPPPYVFWQHFDKKLFKTWGITGAWRQAYWTVGCSLTGIAKALGGAENYVLAQVEYGNALFVRRDVAPKIFPLWSSMSKLRLSDHWLAGYYCHPLRPSVAISDTDLAGFDFRQFTTVQDVDQSLRNLMQHTWAKKNHGKNESSKHIDTELMPFTFERCEACG